MDKKFQEREAELQRLWRSVEIPPLNEFILDLDYTLMKLFSNDASGILWSIFFYYDSVPEKPLSPREVLDFYASLSEEERLLYMLEFC